MVDPSYLSLASLQDFLLAIYKNHNWKDFPSRLRRTIESVFFTGALDLNQVLHW